MKLSICIPVYNFDVRELVFDLKKEIDSHNIDAEIILIDDASDAAFKVINEELQSQVKKLVFLEENIGRSRIRNLFLQYSSGEYLLFLDCDVKIAEKAFLWNYISEINKQPDLELIYGSFIIDPQYASTLRNRYSVEREIFFGSRSYDFSLFKTVNFIISKKIFEKFPFNEMLTEYGYEDFVFAKLLEQNEIKFLAMTNPVIHVDDTSNAVFLGKAEIGMGSLFRLSKNPQNNTFIKDIKVYKAAVILKRFGLVPLFLSIYKVCEKKIRTNLLSENPSIRYFDFYKLAMLVRKMK
ncbi:glycosyltransferase family 2 protein [Chryseobacterium jejuense]|uniref:Glycosyl transferase family 2 n=1 Tax=Chryseobacterium jejuense TaxID=445960 RepID=A0A2X2WVL8_CHRJE|nr:glycosyltransferase family 2 protein [Chryseobacterium jejuense]SDI66365.1 Glycosyl transferase family 2 [Chryseobacterium jejuense]SQB47382.1 putative glycosyl transferase [Chryseobacterium jejuense]